MRTLAVIVFVLFALATVPCAAHAQVNSCLGAHGERVYTDQPCAGAVSPSAVSRGTDSGNSTGYLSANCPASPEELRNRVAGAFGSDDPNILSGLLLWGGVDHQTASARMRDFKRWLQRPLVGVTISGASAPPPPPRPPDDPFDEDDSVFHDALPSDASSRDPRPGDADYVPRHPNGLTVLTQTRGGNLDDDPGPSARRFGIVDRGGCWWLTF
ncbi:MAG: DUF4124 domain-containing protein [Pseudomonadota bacterium]|nr:DUF4124 domain-containing protein [Pseudomonadota bacterium]